MGRRGVISFGGLKKRQLGCVSTPERTKPAVKEPSELA
jgi:hypothetical protein